MKRMTWFGLSALLLATTLTACADELTELNEPTVQNGPTVEFVAAEIAGRTAFGAYDADAKSYPTLWEGGEQIKVNLNLSYDANDDRALLKDPATTFNPKVTATEGGTTATFSVALPADEVESYTFYAVAPGGAWMNTYDPVDSPMLRMKLPAEQTPTDGSCDASAQLLYAASATSSSVPTSVALHFRHVSAYGLLTLKNIEGSVSKVELSAGQTIAGSFYYSTENGEVSFNASGISRKIELTTSRKEGIWFSIIPVDLSEQTLTVKVTTDQGLYTKEIVFSATTGHFRAGRVAKFSVDFEGITPVANDQFVLREVYKNTQGNVEGVVFWVSDDGLTAKIVGLNRCDAAAWWSEDAGEATGAIDQEDGANNMIALSSFLESNHENSIGGSVPYIKIPMTDFCAEQGLGWYWPSYNELRALAATYHGVSAYGSIKRKQTDNLDDGTEFLAQEAFDKLLTDNGGVALNTATTHSTNGDRYWSSSERETDYSGKAARTLAGFVQFGFYNANLYTEKTKSYFGRAVKVVKKPAVADPSVVQNIRYGVQREEVQSLAEANRAAADRLLDLYLPTTTAPTSGYPVLLYVHGGGFAGGDKASGSDVAFCMAMAKKGYAVLSINYYIALKYENDSKTNCTTEMKGGLPQSGAFSADLQNAINKAAEDTAEVLNWIKTQEDYALDTQRVAVSGGSAGAMTVLHLAYLSEQTYLPILGVVDLWGGVADATKIERTTAAGNSPALLIYHGDNDQLINVAYAHALADRLTTIGIPVTKNIIEGGAHASYDYITQWEIEAIDGFLKAL